MKMLTAIINKEDTRAVSAALLKARFSFTKLSTTGGFLMAGNTTLMLGVEDDRVEECIGVLRECCKPRVEVLPQVVGYTEEGPDVQPVTAEVGGAIVFVTPVERFEKL